MQLVPARIISTQKSVYGVLVTAINNDTTKFLLNQNLYLMVLSKGLNFSISPNWMTNVNIELLLKGQITSFVREREITYPTGWDKAQR